MAYRKDVVSEFNFYFIKSQEASIFTNLFPPPLNALKKEVRYSEEESSMVV